LVTLYKNYISNFEFEKYILFLNGVSSTIRINDELNIFDYTNLNDQAYNSIKSGLKEECIKKTYIDNSNIDLNIIDMFLKNVLFVIDDKVPSKYVKSIIKMHPRIIPNEEILTAVFHEIRDKQSAKKNTVVEGVTIETTDQALNYFRHLSSGEIKLLVLGRIINKNPFDKGCPEPFIPIYNSFPEEKRKEALENCKLSLSRALFNKNNSDNFWNLYAEIYYKIMQFPKASTESIFNQLDSHLKVACTDFDVLSLKYFIATIKEGIEI